jgi:hypothetical protein
MSKQNELEFALRQVYGNDCFYPKCERSKQALAALGVKTLTPSIKRALESLGFILVVRAAEVKL